jgi:hypothetical protein
MIMSKIKINSPIWKSRSIGIAEYAMKDEDLIIDILYMKKDGKRLYPHSFKTSKTFAMSQPQQTVGRGVKLRIVRIEDLEIL